MIRLTDSILSRNLLVPTVRTAHWPYGLRLQFSSVWDIGWAMTSELGDTLYLRERARG